ncbi:MAG: GGDEF domain-containing protein [Burkholderiales bacterium]
MELDTRTLIVTAAVNVMLLGVISISFAGVQTGTRAIGGWGRAMILAAVGLAGLALRGAITDFLSIVVANTLILIAFVVALRGLRSIRGVDRAEPFAWGLVVVGFALLIAFTEYAPSYGARVVVMSLCVALLLMRCALALRGEVPPECAHSYAFTQYTFWTMTALLLARAVGGLFEMRAEMLTPGMLRGVSFLLYAILLTAATLGVMWMEIQSLERALVHSARIDALTGVLNRGTFLEEFGREVSRSERDATVFSLAIFDLDHFKRLNDRFGHPMGDRVLKNVVDIMRLTIRRHDLIGRYGGEEFALLMPNTGKDTALRVAERIRRGIELKGAEIGGKRVDLTVSGGVATFQLDGHDWDSLLIAADNALYAAKNAGRNQIVAAGAVSG